MNKCKICGREFKSPQALGGHMRGAHKDETQQDTGPNNADETIDDRVEAGEVPGEETALVPQDASLAEQIRMYLKQGFTIKQLASQFGFSDTTIRQEIAKLVRPEGEAIDDKAKQPDNVWPVVRKMGGGMEVISPEAVLRQYMGGGTPEEQLELRAIMKFRAAMLMVMDLVNVQKGTAEAVTTQKKGEAEAVTTHKKGEAEAPVEVTDRMMRGHVSLPHGFGMEYPDEVGEHKIHGVSLNELTDIEDRDWLALTPFHKHVRVRLEAVPA